jgi:catechol-2,3-dioxygenase
MPAEIKAIVFKTARLKETKQFFENILQLKIKERSAIHFVIHSKNIRLLFIESPGAFELEIYAEENKAGIAKVGIKNYRDPNGINIIVTHQNNNH